MVIFIRILHATALCLVATLLFSAGAYAQETGSSYTWASKRIDGEFWGIAQSDIDNDGRVETVLLERQRIMVGYINDKSFEESFTCGWKGAAKAAKLYLYDLDEDGQDDAVITAVEDGLPASLALKISKDGCEQIISRARWSLRVITEPDSSQKKLIGQGWSTQQYFIGPIYEIALKNKKLKKAEKLKLPARTKLYEFTFLPPIDDMPAVALLKGEERLEVKQHVKGNKWRRVWRSAEKFGGSANYLYAVQRPALDEIASDVAYFDMPPLTLSHPDGVHLFVAHYNFSLKGMIGRHGHVKESRIVEYRPDPALTFVEQMNTQKLSGYVVDYIIARHASNEEGERRQLIVLLQNNISAFESPLQAIILAYDIN
ncbi:MAG: VCBS repeat-containing protein [Pseudomonadota bacterium]